MILAPSTFRPFEPKLQTGIKHKCQRLLTVETEAWGGVLERLEGFVRLETLCQRLCALGTDAIVEEAANKSRFGVSAAADSRDRGVESRCGRRT